MVTFLSFRDLIFQYTTEHFTTTFDSFPILINPDAFQRFQKFFMFLPFLPAQFY